MPAADAVAPYPIRVPDADLADLAGRLARTRWPDAGTVTDGSQGPTLSSIRRLVGRWQAGYDWWAAEALLNGWESSRTVLEKLAVHFLHVRSPEPDAVRLLLRMAGRGRCLNSVT